MRASFDDDAAALASIGIDLNTVRDKVIRTFGADAFDDALVLSRVLAPALELARARDVWLPVRPVTRRRWPNGRITHDELKPLKALAARMPCPYQNPGRYVGGRPMVQGMRVALSSEVRRTHEELVERILHGERLAATQEEKAEVVHQWLASGRPLKQLEKQTGWNGARELRRANEGKAA